MTTYRDPFTLEEAMIEIRSSRKLIQRLTVDRDEWKSVFEDTLDITRSYYEKLVIASSRLEAMTISRNSWKDIAKQYNLYIEGTK